MKISEEVLVTSVFFIILSVLKMFVGFESAVLFGIAVAITKVVKGGLK